MELLTTCYLFWGLSESQLDRLAAITTEVRIQKGKWLFFEGEEAEEHWLPPTFIAFLLAVRRVVALLPFGRGTCISSFKKTAISVVPS
jgi:hypothetical protein